MFDVNKIKNDFPMFKNNKEMQGKNFVYFDNASTTFKPQSVIEKINKYYTSECVNSHRGDYDIAHKVDEQVLKTRRNVAKFINADINEVVFTSGATMSLNLIARGYGEKFLNKGDEIAYHIIGMKEPEVDKNVTIIYDDGDLIIANKPANLPVIPSGKYYHNTLHTIVREMLQCNINMLNRIDRETSGCVVLSRGHEVASKFCAMIAGRKLNNKKRSIKKTYIAIVENAKDIEDKFIVEGYMLESGHKYYRRFQTLHKENVEGSKYSKTAFKTIKRIGDYAIVMARLYTGRMHQIRVHLYSKNLYMVGDKIYGKYGPQVFDDFIEKNIIPEGFFPRQALHAYSLEFNHPITDELIKVKAPLSEDLKKFIRKLKYI